MDQLFQDGSSDARWNSLLIGGFAALALVLAAVGIYGVLAYAVVLRSREIGVRMTLGATAGSVVRMVVREGKLLAILGVAAGVALALALGKLAEGLLHDIKPHDSATLAAVATALLMVALAASAIPARRAARVDPIATLRAE
jgi:putative ABC transport system permease protein